MKKKTPKQSPKKKVVKKTKKKAVKKSNKLITITSPIDPQVRIMIASEQMDDQLIEKELMGQALPYYIYQFCDNRGARCDAAIVKAGKCPHDKVVGLSFKGVSEVVRRLNRNAASGYKIRINPEFLKKDEVEREGMLGVEVSVYAEDMITGNSAWGIKFEPYMKKKRDGSTYRNEFPTEKALSKAERNAKRKLIPETPAALMIQKLMKENRGAHILTIDAPKTVEHTVKPPAPVASTPKELMSICIKEIAKAKELGRVVDIDERAQKSDKLTDEMKKEIHEKALARADVLGE